MVLRYRVMIAGLAGALLTVVATGFIGSAVESGRDVTSYVEPGLWEEHDDATA